ncbi:MAG: DNA helicase, partial [Bacteroidetes bacterium]|nr:DNA helicase [Bacteroidota bacterium]
MNPSMTFRQYLPTAFIHGPWATDEVVAFVLPLFEEVLGLHENGLVAPFDKIDCLFITDNRLDIDEDRAHMPRFAHAALQPLLKHDHIEGFDITERLLEDHDTGSGLHQNSSAEVQTDTAKPLTHPVYLPGYGCYEQQVGHHDARTDIFCLGLVLGSLVMGLDLYDADNLAAFVRYRRQPAGKNPRIHATICALVTEMTELYPPRRSRDMQEIIERLKYYRDYDPLRQTDLSGLTATMQIKKPADRKEFILGKLRNRL